MDKNLKYGILILAGGVGVYIIWKGGYLQQWFPSLFGTATPTPAPTPSTQPSSTPPPTHPPVIPPPSTPPPPGTNYPAAGTPSTVNGQTYIADGHGGWNPVAPSHNCPTGQHWSALDNACVCDDGSTNVNGVCQGQHPAPAVLSISQRMVAAAGQTDGLDLDQWCYYYTQVTGNACPRDPGDIIAAAGDPSPSFPQGRSTPIDIGTWLAFMNQDGAGLTGLAALHVANAWLT